MNRNVKNKFKEDFKKLKTKYVFDLIENPRRYIYALMDEQENILFIGQCQNPETIIYTHIKSKSFCKYKYFECDPKKASEIHLDLCEKYRPPLNFVAPQSDEYCSLDKFKRLNPEIKGYHSPIRRFLKNNPVKTKCGLYPVEYLEKMKEYIVANERRSMSINNFTLK